MIRATVAAAIALIVVFAVPAAATAAPQATIVAFSYQGGAAAINIGVAVPKGIDSAARSGSANWGLDITVTYVDVNNQVQTLDSGHLSVKNDTVFLSSIDQNTDLVQATLAFSPLPLPGNNPSFTGTATLLQP